MGAASRRKGAAAEVAVVKHLRDHGFPAAERRIAGTDDALGDITGIPGLVIEVKNQKALNLAGWVDQLGDELDTARVDHGAVIHKRPGKIDVGEWYATMPVAVLLDLLRAVGYGDATTARPLAATTPGVAL